MKIDLLGVKINIESKEKILRNIETLLDPSLSLRTGKPVFIVTPYSESIVAAQKDPEFQNILNSADFAISDGAGVVWAADFLKNVKLERIPGREFFWDLCALAESRGESVFLLGGFGDTPDLVTAKLKAKFPKLGIAGAYAPDFSDCHSEADRPRQSHQGDCFSAEGRIAMTDRIKNSGASILFVALGPIRQEKWIYRNFPNLRVKLAMGVGGTFDYIAGKKPQPPQFLSSWGLEWLWRLLTQPWRAWRITKGVLGLIWYTLKARI